VDLLFRAKHSQNVSQGLAKVLGHLLTRLDYTVPLELGTVYVSASHKGPQVKQLNCYNKKIGLSTSFLVVPWCARRDSTVRH